jgi:hypothetical protein
LAQEPDLNLDRISIMMDSFSGISTMNESVIKLFRNGQEFNDYHIQEYSVIAQGGKDIVFNSPAPEGDYEIKVTPIRRFNRWDGSDPYLAGDNYTFALKVDNNYKTLATSQPSFFSDILDWIKSLFL